MVSCSHQKKESNTTELKRTVRNKPSVIIDCNYTFEEATRGTKAPEEIIQQLKLINVQYYSTIKRFIRVRFLPM